MLGVVKELGTDAKCFIRIGEFMAFYQGGPVGVRLSYLAATAILVIFVISVGANVVHVNAGRPYPILTVGPGGCIEGQASVQEWCPGQEYRTWKRAKVCHNGQLVQETHDCTTETQTETQTAECSAGDPPKDVTHCEKDLTQWATRKECVNGVWKEVTNPSPCPECNGLYEETIIYCPNDPTKWEYLRTCVKGHIVEERQECGADCTPGQEGACIKACDWTNKCGIKWYCEGGKWVSRNTGECCYIATATYGSALSPEVQLLRNFRDRDVLQTYAGGEGMKVFNLIYYSFSPQVAHTISTNENLRTVMRYLLYPLIGILWAAQQLYTALAFSPEGAIVVAGVFTGSMIGLLYALPFYGVSLAVSRAFRRKLTFKHVSLLLVLLATASTLIVVSEVTRFDLLMQLSTSLLALTSAALPGITLSAWALNRRRPVTG
jgi:hypothetical protein